MLSGRRRGQLFVGRRMYHVVGKAPQRLQNEHTGVGRMCLRLRFPKELLMSLFTTV